MNGAVIIEGVNLASTSARRDADALVSRLLRIREGGAVNVLIGYVASPGGLNGETDMRDWIEAKVTQNVFDVISESERFQAAAVREFESLGLSKH